MPLTGKSVALTAAGGILLWSGISGTSLSTAFRDVLSGQPVTQDQEPIAATGSSGSDSSGISGAAGSVVASDAEKYAGSPYVWGGSPGEIPGVDLGTDCSGFVNMVVGRDLGMPIPGYAGGAYNGSTHGPTSQEWLLWSGCSTIPEADVEPGDLACWVTHMGIFTDAQNVISALDTESGVIVTTVAGAAPPAEPLTCRRLK